MASQKDIREQIERLAKAFQAKNWNKFSRILNWFSDNLTDDELAHQQQAVVAKLERARTGKDAVAFFYRGLAKSDLGQPEEAIKEYDRAIKLNPKYENAFTNRGYAKSELGQYEEAIRDYDRAISLNPEDALAFTNRGNAKSDLGQPEEAIKDYNRAISLNPEFAGALTNRGLAKHDLGQYEEAIKDHNQALAHDPDLALALINRGNTKKALGQHQEAIEDYDRAIGLNPRDALAFTNRGSAKSDLGQHQEAIKDYDRAIKLNPKYAAALTNRGAAKYNLGNHQEALADFDRAIELDPKDALAFVHRGNVMGCMNLHKEAIKDFDQAIELDPKNAAAFNNRGVDKIDLGQFDKAIDDFNEALRLQPDYADAFHNRSLVKYESRDFSAALADNEKSLELEPSNPKLQNFKGYILLALEEEEKAEEVFQKIGKVEETDLPQTETGRPDNKTLLQNCLKNLSGDLTFLKEGRDKILSRSPHEDVLYLYALLDHAMRNTYCYIQYMDFKCDRGQIREQLAKPLYNIRNFGQFLQKTFERKEPFPHYPRVEQSLSRTGHKLPEAENTPLANLNHAINIRNEIAHGKGTDKKTVAISNRWEAISGVEKEKCYEACRFFIEFFEAYMTFFQKDIQQKESSAFNPFNDNFQDCIRPKGRGKSQAEPTFSNDNKTGKNA